MADGIEDALRVLAEYVTLPYGVAPAAAYPETRRQLLDAQAADPRNREMMERILAAGTERDPLGWFVTSLAQVAGRMIHPPDQWRVCVKTFPKPTAAVELEVFASGHGSPVCCSFPMERILGGWNRAEAMLSIANGVGEVRSKL